MSITTDLNEAIENAIVQHLASLMPEDQDDAKCHGTTLDKLLYAVRADDTVREYGILASKMEEGDIRNRTIPLCEPKFRKVKKESVWVRDALVKNDEWRSEHGAQVFCHVDEWERWNNAPGVEVATGESLRENATLVQDLAHIAAAESLKLACDRNDPWAVLKLIRRSYGLEKITFDEILNFDADAT